MATAPVPSKPTPGAATSAPTVAAATPGLDPQRAVQIVASFLIVGGVLWIIRIHPILVLIGVAELALGIGLLKRKPGFRIGTLVWCGLIMGVMALNAVVIALTKEKHQHLFPMGGREASKAIQLLLTILMFALHALGYRILKRPAVQALFFRNP